MELCLARLMAQVKREESIHHAVRGKMTISIGTLEI